MRRRPPKSKAYAPRKMRTNNADPQLFSGLGGVDGPWRECDSIVIGALACNLDKQGFSRTTMGGLMKYLGRFYTDGALAKLGDARERYRPFVLPDAAT